jgi:DnaK suppressor protein
MNQEQLDFFRDRLDNMSKDLLVEADKTLSEMTDNNENYPDPTDRATVESDRNFELRIRDRERKLLAKIKSAIERIDEGSYGECDGCGDDISIPRLKARPVTTLCIECKTKQEDFEKSQQGR